MMDGMEDFSDAGMPVDDGNQQLDWILNQE